MYNRNKLLYFLFVCFFISSLVNATLVKDVGAWKAGGAGGATHGWIFKRAKWILEWDGKTSIADFLGSEASEGQTYLDVMIAGSNEADGGISAKNHFMNPTDHGGLYGLESAGVLCNEKFNEAVGYWGNGDKVNAMRYLGWAAHLVQDSCVPFHAYLELLGGHTQYEDYVDDNKVPFGLASGGTYTFSRFPDADDYSAQHVPHYLDTGYPFNWVDYNAHESIQYFCYVNQKLTITGYKPVENEWVTFEKYNVETVHKLPDDIESTWVVTMNGSDEIQIRFSEIDLAQDDLVEIYDGNDILQETYTNINASNVWTPLVSGDTLKIKTITSSTDGTMSWGYKTDHLKFYDTVHDFDVASEALLKRAQRTTAGFISFFFDCVGFKTGDLYMDNQRGGDSQDIWYDLIDDTITRIYAKIHNGGDSLCSAGSEVYFYYTWYYPHWILCVPEGLGENNPQTLGSIPAGGYATTSITWTSPTPDPEGSSHLCIKVEVESSGADPDESNNDAWENKPYPSSYDVLLGETMTLVIGFNNTDPQPTNFSLTYSFSALLGDWTFALSSLRFTLDPSETELVTLNITNTCAPEAVTSIFPVVITAMKNDNFMTTWVIGTHAPTVGGISLSVNKLELLAPYIGLTMLLAVAVVAVVYVKKRKRNTEINS